MADKIYGIYKDEEVLLDAINHLNTEGVKIKDVYTPFPVHGLDVVMDIKPTRLSNAAFIYGLTGLSLGVLMVWYMLIHDWPIDIGGKPNFDLYRNLPSFIPVLFECTVLCAAHGMVLTFLLVSKYLPGIRPTNPFPETTSDRFAIEIEANGNTADPDVIKGHLQKTNAFEIKEK